MTKTPGQVLLEMLHDSKIEWRAHYEQIAAAVIAAAKPQIEAEARAVAILAAANKAAEVFDTKNNPHWTDVVDAIQSLAALPPTHVCVPVSVAKFAAWLIREARENMCGFDGGELQDRMVSDGVLVEFAAIEPCGEDCSCAQFGFPAQCYRLTDGVSDLLAASKGDA